MGDGSGASWWDIELWILGSKGVTERVERLDRKMGRCSNVAPLFESRIESVVGGLQ